MKNTKTITEALSALIPADQRAVIEEAVSNLMTEAEKNIRTEYEKQLEESYEEWQGQMNSLKESYETKIEESESVALNGYNEAREMLVEAEEKLRLQKEEFETFLESEYAVAKQMIEDEKLRNDEIEEKLYESYTAQVDALKEDIVSKLDSFLSDKIEEITESLRKELKNDPTVLESKVAFDRIRDIVVASSTSGDVTRSTSEKLEELEEAVSTLRAENKRLIARNMRLEATAVAPKKAPVEEPVEPAEDDEEMPEGEEVSKKRKMRRLEAERRVAEKAAMKAEGRGDIISRNDLITEGAPATKDNTKVIEGLGISVAEMQRLSGITRY